MGIRLNKMIILCLLGYFLSNVSVGGMPTGNPDTQSSNVTANSQQSSDQNNNNLFGITFSKSDDGTLDITIDLTPGYNSEDDKNTVKSNNQAQNPTKKDATTQTSPPEKTENIQKTTSESTNVPRVTSKSTNAPKATLKSTNGSKEVSDSVSSSTATSASANSSTTSAPESQPECTALQLYSIDNPGQILIVGDDSNPNSADANPNSEKNTNTGNTASVNQGQKENIQNLSNTQQQQPGDADVMESYSEMGAVIVMSDDASPEAEDDTNKQQTADQLCSANATQNQKQNGCQTASSSKPSSSLQLTQVTSSQILYHMNLQYEDMNKNTVSKGQETDSLETFLLNMLGISENKTIDSNKKIISTTYAAYYSTEYAYTFSLCKLQGLTGLKNSDTTSNCSEVVEQFQKFSVLYKTTITKSLEDNGSQLLQYTGNLEDPSTNEKNQLNAHNDKYVTKNDEIIRNKNLEKTLNGYNDTSYINKKRTESDTSDQYDRYNKQNIGKATYSQETKGKFTDSLANMTSEITPLSLDNGDTLTGVKRHVKMANLYKMKDDSNTIGKLENDEKIVDTKQSKKDEKIQKVLAETFQNIDNDDNNDIGGNITNAKSQVVTKRLDETIEHDVEDVNQTVTYKNPSQSDNGQFTFDQAINNLLQYIETLDKFITNMDTSLNDEKNKTKNNGKELYSTMYASIYKETIIYRRYLKNYFTNVNVDNGVPTSSNDIENENTTSGDEILDVTIQRFLWVKKIIDGQKSGNDGSPLKLLWYIEEARFYLSDVVGTEQGANVPFMGYLPYPDYNVKTDQNNQNGVDIQFYLM